MQRKRKGLLALWMVWVLLLTTVPMPVGADGTDAAVKLYGGTEVLKPGTATGNYTTGNLSPGMSLDEKQAGLALLYGTGLKGNCPNGYTRDGWRIWKDESGLKAGRWIGDTDVNWASYLTGYYDSNNGNVIFAPNWVPKYAAGETDGTDSKAAVIKRVEDGSILINGNKVTGGGIEADGSIQADGAAFHFQWLHEYKLVETPADANQIKGTSSMNGDYYNASTGKWMKGNGETSSLGITCGLQAGDIVLVKDIGGSGSDVPYYFNGYLWNEDNFAQTYLETYDRENKVFYAVVPDTGENYTLCLANMNSFMEINASVSVFRADSKTADQTSAVFTGGAGTYCCKVSYEQALATGTQKETFSFLTDIITVAEKYEITNMCGPNGSCSIEVDGKEVYGPGIMAAPGQTVTVKAVPADGYAEGVFSIRKTGEISGSDVPYSTTEDGKGNKIRTFTMPDYPVTVQVDFTQKTDTEKPVISGVDGGNTYYGPVTFRVEDASPVNVWLDGKQIQPDKDGTYTIQPDNKTHTITASDAAGNTIICTIMVYEEWVRAGIINICGENGICIIEVDGKEETGPSIHAAPGQTVKVKAVPDAGYEEGTISVRKTGEAGGLDVPYTTTEDENGNKIRTFTMPDYPVTVSASFKQKEQKTYTVTLPEGTGYTVQAEEGSVSPVAEGGSYSFTVTVADGYEATEHYRVLSNGTELKAEAGSTYTYTIENITSNQTIMVEGIAKVKEEDKDEEKPVISGVDGGNAYYGPVTFRVEDASPVEVWLDGKLIQLEKDGTYTIQPDNKSHTITASDAYGNTSTCTITVYEVWVRDGITANGSYELRSGTAYKLGFGTWKTAEDDTVYAGGNTFYVPIAKNYTFFLQSGIRSETMKPFRRTFLKR